MKTQNTFRSIRCLYVLVLISQVLIMSSCDSDRIGDESLYTFTDKLVGQYIDADSTLTEFAKLIEKTKVRSLLNSYGQFTCFAPNNDAMFAYYQEKGKASLDDFPEDSLRMIVYDHLINGAAVNYVNFNVGRLFNLTMSDRYLSVHFDAGGQAYVNQFSRILSKDIVVHNGVIHTINKVLDPVRSGLAEVVSKDERFSIFYAALVATGLVDSILLTIDDSFEMTAARARELEDAVATSIASVRVAPRSRKFGYTLLMESDNTMQKNGITNLESLRTYAASVYDQIYPADAGITDVRDRRNSLNRFVAYHIINKELSYTKFILDYDSQHMSKLIDMFEYIEPMCPNTLIEVKIQRTTGEANLFNYNSVTREAIRLVPGNFDNDATNGVYHEIDGMLVYSSAVDSELSSKRLRFDVASFFSELTNNNMRGRPSDKPGVNLYRNAIPPGYLDRFRTNNDQTVICLSSPHDHLMNYQGDEFFLTVPLGKLYDFVMITPPVPAGTYEIRFGYQANGRRGVAQFYVDGIPAGVPVNLNNAGSHVEIGYVRPGDDPLDPQGFENDKMMRNRGYMKGPNSFKSPSEAWYSGSSARNNGSNLRKILGTYNFREAGHHEIMVKGLSSGQFQIDFLEFVPTSVLENEDVN